MTLKLQKAIEAIRNRIPEATKGKKTDSPAKKTRNGDSFDNGTPTTASPAPPNQTQNNTQPLGKGTSAQTPTTAAAVPQTPEELRRFPELADATTEELQTAFKAIHQVATGNASEKLQGLATLAKTFPETLKETLETLGIQDEKIVKLASDAKTLKALATLANPNASNVDKAKAALELSIAVGKAFDQKEAVEALKTTLDSLGLASELVDAITAWADPGKSALEKAQATLALANQLKSFLGNQFPQFAADLRFLDGSLKAVGAALTLLDPNASAGDKLMAGMQLAVEIPDISRDLQGFLDALRNLGADNSTLEALNLNLGCLDSLAGKLEIKELETVLGKLVNNPGEMSTLIRQLSEMEVEDAKKLLKTMDSLHPDVLAKTIAEPEMLENLTRLAKTLDAEDLKKVLGGLADKPGEMSSLLKQLSGMEANDANKLLKTLKTLRPDMLAKTIADPQLLGDLAHMLGKLDKEAAEKLGKLVANMDDEMLRHLAALGRGGSSEQLKTLIKGLDKAGIDGKTFGSMLKMLAKAGGKLGFAITEELAEKILKSLLKMIPIAGVVPSAVDYVDYMKHSLELAGQNPDLAAFARVGANLNGADAAFAIAGIILDATGAGAAIGLPGDLAVSIPLALAELAVDIAFKQELAKFNADPENYKAPDWMRMVNVIGNDPVTLMTIYGVEGSTELVQWAIEEGVEGALEVAEAIGVGAANLAGEGLQMTAEGLHLAADVLRNPEKYAQAVVDDARMLLSAAVEAGGELADKAKEVVSNVIEEAKALGEKGLETLKYFAQNPDELAKMALQGIEDMVAWGLETRDKIYQAGLEVLGELKERWNAFGEAAADFIADANKAINNTLNKAIELGEKGLEALVWIANNPGEAMDKAKKELTKILANGGELAKKAWDEISSLGAKGLELAESVISSLHDAGKAAVDTLRYIAENPGEAAEKVCAWVGQTFEKMIRNGGEAAEKAAKALMGFVDKQMEWAYKFAQNLISDGVKTFTNVLSAWKDNLTEGGKAVLGGLADLGEAGMERVSQLADAIGGEVKNFAKNFKPHWSMALGPVGYLIFRP